MNKLGKPLLVIGAVIVLIALSMGTSVETGYGRFNNIGLIADRSNYLFLGALLFVAGLILNANIRTEQKRAIPADTGEMQCPFCAELIKKEAKICKHCKSHVDAQMPQDTAPMKEPKEDPEVPIGAEPEKSEPVPLDRSLLNRTYSEDFYSELSEHQIKKTLANELKKIDRRFNENKLNYISSGAIFAEASIENKEANNWSVNVNYQKEGSLWMPLVSFLAIFTYTVATDNRTLAGVVVILGPIVIILRLLFSNKFTERKIRSAIRKTKEQV